MEFIVDEDVTVNITEMSWHFTAPVVEVFEDMGIAIPSGLTTFILKFLTNNTLKDGSIDFLMIGLGLRIVKEKSRYTVNLIEEDGRGQGK